MFFIMKSIILPSTFSSLYVRLDAAMSCTQEKPRVKAGMTRAVVDAPMYDDFRVIENTI